MGKPFPKPKDGIQEIEEPVPQQEGETQEPAGDAAVPSQNEGASGETTPRSETPRIVALDAGESVKKEPGYAAVLDESTTAPAASSTASLGLGQQQPTAESTPAEEKSAQQPPAGLPDLPHVFFVTMKDFFESLLIQQSLSQKSREEILPDENGVFSYINKEKRENPTIICDFERSSEFSRISINGKCTSEIIGNGHNSKISVDDQIKKIAEALSISGDGVKRISETYSQAWPGLLNPIIDAFMQQPSAVAQNGEGILLQPKCKLDFHSAEEDEPITAYSFMDVSQFAFWTSGPLRTLDFPFSVVYKLVYDRDKQAFKMDGIIMCSEAYLLPALHNRHIDLSNPDNLSEAKEQHEQYTKAEYEWRKGNRCLFPEGTPDITLAKEAFVEKVLLPLAIRNAQEVPLPLRWARKRLFDAQRRLDRLKEQELPSVIANPIRERLDTIQQKLNTLELKKEKEGMSKTEIDTAIKTDIDGDLTSAEERLVCADRYLLCRKELSEAQKELSEARKELSYEVIQGLAWSLNLARQKLKELMLRKEKLLKEIIDRNTKALCEAEKKLMDKSSQSEEERVGELKRASDIIFSFLEIELNKIYEEAFLRARTRADAAKKTLLALKEKKGVHATIINAVDVILFYYDEILQEFDPKSGTKSSYNVGDLKKAAERISTYADCLETCSIFITKITEDSQQQFDQAERSQQQPDWDDPDTSVLLRECDSLLSRLDDTSIIWRGIKNALRQIRYFFHSDLQITSANNIDKAEEKGNNGKKFNLVYVAGEWYFYGKSDQGIPSLRLLKDISSTDPSFRLLTQILSGKDVKWAESEGARLEDVIKSALQPSASTVTHKHCSDNLHHLYYFWQKQSKEFLQDRVPKDADVASNTNNSTPTVFCRF